MKTTISKIWTAATVGIVIAVVFLMAGWLHYQGYLLYDRNRSRSIAAELRHLNQEQSGVLGNLASDPRKVVSMIGPAVRKCDAQNADFLKNHYAAWVQKHPQYRAGIAQSQ